MVKILFLLAVVFTLLAVFRARITHRTDTPQPPASRAPETMVACDHCGTHIPLHESLEANGRRYCCEEHLRLG
ncbi:MAG: PP0621 family protein [Rhodocyclaceae bacterium]|nr:PP0621 family protein [Rhodocyclaceae bacterium]